MFNNSFAQSELQKILNQDLKSKFASVDASISEKRFVVGDLGITYRWLTHWDQKDLLITKEETSKWRRYDFVDFVWIKMIQKLRAFNVSLAQVKIIKDQLIQEINYEDAINTNEIRDAVKKLNPTVSEAKIDEILNEALNSNQAKKESINFLKLFILDVIVLKNHFAILLNEKMEIVIYKDNFRSEYLKNEAFTNFLLGSHLSISISELLVEFIALNELELSCENLELITEEEKEVLQFIRDNSNLKSATIKFQNGKMETLELTEVKTINMSHRLTDIMMSGGYEELTIKSQNGQIVHCENTRKIKLQGTK